MIRLSPVGQTLPVLKELVSEARSHQKMKMFWDYRKPQRPIALVGCFSLSRTIQQTSILLLFFHYWLLSHSSSLVLEPGVFHSAFVGCSAAKCTGPIYWTRVQNGSILSGLRGTACQIWSPHLLRAACYWGLISLSVPRAAPRAIDFCHRCRLSSAQPFVFDLSPKQYKRSCFLHLISAGTSLRCG